MKLFELINREESVTLEFKERLAEPEKLAKLLVSFSNQKGGQIVVGVSDDKELVGIDPEFSFEEWVMNIASTNCHPVIHPIVERIHFKEKLFALIRVHAGNFTPYMVKSLGETAGVYVRIGSTNRQADQATFKSLQLRSLNLTFDRLEVVTSGISDIDIKKVENFFSITKKNFIRENLDDALLNVGILKKKNGGLYPTVGGLLIFGKNSQLDTHLQNAVIQLAVFKDPGHNMVVNEIAEGDLIEQIQKVELFFQKYLKKESLQAGFKRNDNFEYPMEVLRELTVNAVTHRDYSLANSRSIRISIDDRSIIFESPGHLPEDVTAENIYDKQVSRNPWIARILHYIGYTEEWGEGMDRIRQSLNDNPDICMLIIEGENWVKFVLEKKRN